MIIDTLMYYRSVNLQKHVSIQTQFCSPNSTQGLKVTSSNITPPLLFPFADKRPSKMSWLMPGGRGKKSHSQLLLGCTNKTKAKSNLPLRCLTKWTPFCIQFQNNFLERHFLYFTFPLTTSRHSSGKGLTRKAIIWTNAPVFLCMYASLGPNKLREYINPIQNAIYNFYVYSAF